MASPVASWCDRCTDSAKPVRPGFAGSPRGGEGELEGGGAGSQVTPFGFPAPGVRSPYSQIPNLEESTRPELKTRNLAPRSEIQLPKSYLPSRPKLKPKPTPRRPGKGQTEPGLSHSSD